jgi:hypothetical protein
MKNNLIAMFVLTALGNLAAFHASESWAADRDSFSIATGFDYSSGKYGSSNTTSILSIPFIGMYKTGLWMFNLTVPYVWISGNGSVVLGMGGSMPGMSGSASGMMSGGSVSTTQSGLGDVVAAASHNIYSGIDSADKVNITGKVKFGTAETGLGTGENDYAAQVDVYQGYDQFTVMGSLGYLILGNPPGGNFNNVAYGIVGVYSQLSGQIGGGAEMRISQKYSDTTSGQGELTIYLNHKFGKGQYMRGYVLKGFSDGSPDFGFGLLVASEL